MKTNSSHRSHYLFSRYKALIFWPLFVFISLPTHALVSLESVVLGDFSPKYSKDKDPLDYIFKREENLSGLELKTYRENLSLYRGFYEEGKNLLNQCKRPYEIRYESLWHKSQVKRALGASMQYALIDLSTRALPVYAKYFEFDQEEYQKMVEGLVNNHCSDNLSILSKRTLKKNFLYRFQNDSDFRLPTVAGNPLFGEGLASLQTSRLVMEQEFKIAIELFKSSCSWSGASEEYGLMTPLMKHPSLFAFLIRQWEAVELSWRSSSNVIEKKNTDKVLNVWCENLICRRIIPSAFKTQVYRMLGSDNLSEDLKKVYCEEILPLDYDIKNTRDENIVKNMKARSFEDENYLSSYAVSLITGIPDFILRSKNFTELEEVFRSNIDATWLSWAKKQIEEVPRSVYYEEPLTLELINNNRTFSPKDRKFDIYLDVNMGEFDRIVENKGKLKASYNFLVSAQLLQYIRREVENLDPREREKKDYFYGRVRAQLDSSMGKLTASFQVVPWVGDFAGLVTQELIDQVASKEPKMFEDPSIKEFQISLHFHYGVFALKAINHMRNVESQNKNLVPRP